MAIVRYDQIRAGLRPVESVLKTGISPANAAQMHSMLYQPVTPSPGLLADANIPTCGLAGEALISYPGQIPFSNPPSGMNAYLAGLSGWFGPQAGCSPTFLCDRLWHNASIDPFDLGAQAVNSVAFPPRDRNESSDGEGLLVCLEMSQTSAALVFSLALSPLTSISYTNSIGVPGRTAVVMPSPNTVLFRVGATTPLLFQEGDTGIRSIESLTLAASITNLVEGVGLALHLVVYRMIAMVPGKQSSCTIRPEVQGPLALCLPRLYNNSVLYLLCGPQTSASATFVRAFHISTTQG